MTITSLGLNFGGPGGFPQGRTDLTFVLSDTASYLRGRHAIKVGGEFRRFNNENFTSDTGTFTFPTVADFQAGRGSQFGITLGDRPSDITQQALGLFVQDSLRLTSNLLLELGLRYDANFAPTDSEDRFVVFDEATASLVRVGSNGRDSIYESSHDVVPRVGVVWDPFKDGKTSVRGAFAIAIDQPVTNVVTPTTANPPLAVPVAFGGAVRLDSAITTALASGLAPASVNPDFKGGRMQNWNVNVERQIGSAMGVMVGYFGSKGDRLRISRNINQFVNGVRPYPRLSATSPILPGASLGNITEVGSFGESHYHGLWISANQRLSRGLQFNASYTLSKSTDYNSLSSQGVVVQDSFNLADSEGPSDFDARHRFVINAIYELPFTGNWLKEGWQVGFIVQAQSGNPISIVTAINTFTGVANTLRPDLIGDPAIVGTPDKWFENSVCDPRISGSCGAGSVFALPVSPTGAFHFGNLGRNAVLGPGFSNTDLSLIKNTKIGPTRLQLRVEAFNLFNRANFGQPGRIAAVGSTAFGVITNTRFPTGDSGSARQIQFAVKALF